MSPKRKTLIPSFKMWLSVDQAYVLGKGGFSLLEAVKKYGSITEAARQTGVSYKYAWDHLSDIEKALETPLLKTRIGGKDGGGAELTEAAEVLIKDYKRIDSYLHSVLKDNEYWEVIGLKISARNRLKGVVESVEKGAVASNVKIKIQVPVTITAVITKEAVEDLGIEVGDQVEAVIKATEVMVAKE